MNAPEVAREMVGESDDARAVLLAALGPDGLASLRSEDARWLCEVLDRHGGLPSLQALWMLMDAAWHSLGCDPQQPDERIGRFYRHPVWLLNTMFIEQDAESLAHRRSFASWIARQRPATVADIGGGGGTLARSISEAWHGVKVDIVEPHPSPAMVHRAAASSRIAYVPELRGFYDVLVATDVFEHVHDPLQMLADMLAHLRPGSHCLIANCFWPVIQCHLPQHFHFRHSWDVACAALGLQPGVRVAHARVYQYTGECNAQALLRARAIESRSRRYFHRIERLPSALAARLGPPLFRILS
jgi:SAM-dependent methyltransferase